MPTFDAKGIETVRRDSCPAVGKTLEATLRILFSTKDLSQVRPELLPCCSIWQRCACLDCRLSRLYTVLQGDTFDTA